MPRNTLAVSGSPLRLSAVLCALLLLLLASGFTPIIADDSEPSKNDQKDSPLGIEAAQHLLGRTTFGAPFEVVQQVATLTRKEAVRDLLATLTTGASTPLPAWATLSPIEIRKQRGESEETRKAFQRKTRQWQNELRAWWTRELLSTSSPLTERLVLMWHGHFTSEMKKVRSAQAMLRQNQLFRSHGSGDFRKLLHAIALDPAMNIYLDTRRSNRNKPNENFARELFELYGLGEGNYTENDIKEAARAFTGYRINGRSGNVQKNRRQHDPGQKTVLGVSGALGAPQVVDAVLQQPACSRWISRRFWTEFVSPEPDAAVIEQWAQLLIEQDWQLKALLEQVLLSDAFWAPENRAALIKSPVDLVIGTIRRFQLEHAPAGMALRSVTRLGQVPFDPPNVAGWPGGEQWIDATTLLERRRFLAEEIQSIAMLAMKQASAAGRPSSRKPDPATDEEPEMDPQMDPQMKPASREAPMRLSRADRRRLSPRVQRQFQQIWVAMGDQQAARVENLQQWLLPLTPVTEVPEAAGGLQLMRSVMLDPTYQLK